MCGKVTCRVPVLARAQRGQTHCDAQQTAFTRARAQTRTVELSDAHRSRNGREFIVYLCAKTLSIKILLVLRWELLYYRLDYITRHVLAAVLSTYNNPCSTCPHAVGNVETRCAPYCARVDKVKFYRELYCH